MFSVFKAAFQRHFLGVSSPSPQFAFCPSVASRCLHLMPWGQGPALLLSPPSIPFCSLKCTLVEDPLCSIQEWGFCWNGKCCSRLWGTVALPPLRKKWWLSAMNLSENRRVSLRGNGRQDPPSPEGGAWKVLHAGASCCGGVRGGSALDRVEGKGIGGTGASMSEHWTNRGTKRNSPNES